MIICSAILTTDGVVHTGKRHSDIFALIAKLGGRNYHKGSEQGFVDNQWAFRDRESAYTRAKIFDQLTREAKERKDKSLYSEDLY